MFIKYIFCYQNKYMLFSRQADNPFQTGKQFQSKF